MKYTNMKYLLATILIVLYISSCSKKMQNVNSGKIVLEKTNTEDKQIEENEKIKVDSFWEEFRKVRDTKTCKKYNKKSICIQNPLKKEVIQGREKISRGGTIQSYFCPKCEETSKRFLISSDTDMVFFGVIGLYSKEQDELFIARLTKDEHKNFIPNEIQDTLRVELKRNDLVLSNNKYKYCPKCNSEIVSHRIFTLAEFYKTGGNIYCIEY